MRTRSKTLYSEITAGGPWTDYRDQDNNGSFETLSASGTTSARTTVDVGEVMTDDPGPSRGIKYVDHERYNFVASSAQPIQYQVSGQPKHELRGANVMFDQYGFPSRFSRSEVTPSYVKDYGEQLRDTLDLFYNDNEVDNLVNLTELHEIPSTIASLLSLVNTRSIISALRRRPLKSNLKGVARNVANAHLAWSFGLSPLIADIKKLQKSFRSLRQDLQRHKMLAGKVVTVRTRQTGSLALTSPGRVGSIHYNKELTQLMPPLRIISVQGVRHHKYNSDFFQNLDYLLKKFGSNGPASFVWEKIPYSFVVDWFLDTRDIINRLDNLSTGSEKIINAVYVSEKWGAQIAARLTDAYASGKFPSSYSRPIGSTTVLSSYTRKAVNTNTQVGLSGRFGKRQLLLSWDLLYQKIAKR